MVTLDERDISWVTTRSALRCQHFHPLSRIFISLLVINYHVKKMGMYSFAFLRKQFI